MSLTLVALLLMVFGITNGDTNILLNKPQVASEHSEYGYLLNNGDTSSEVMYFDSFNVKWAVFDMGDVYKLSKIVTWNRGYGGKVPISFYLGNEFNPCKFHKQILQYNACKVNASQTGDSTSITCATTGNTGRYLAVVKGNFNSTQNLETLYLFEVQAFGTIVTGQTTPSRPALVNGNLNPITIRDFKIAPAILNGVNTLTFPQYSSAMMFLNQNCEPIIWDPSSLSPFAIACQTPDGLGRLAVFGKDQYLKETLSDNARATFKKNLLSWLSPNSKNPAVVDTSKVKSVSDLNNFVKPGDIIDFNGWNTYPDDVVAAIINLCLKGINPISFDHTFWGDTSPVAKGSIIKILRTFNVDFPTSIMNWDSSIDMTVTVDSFTDGLIGIEKTLDRMCVSNDYLVANGNGIVQQLLALNTNLVLNSGVKSKLQSLIAKYDALLNWICPCSFRPATDPGDRAIINVFSQLMLSQALANSNYKLPCIDLYPGDYSTPPATTSVTITINSQTDNTNQPIGTYLAAGSTLQYSVSQSVGTWYISVGCASDILDDGRSGWTRYPNIYTNMVILNQNGQVYSPFGGAIWLINSNAGDSITVKFTNVVATPFFNGRDPTAATTWAKQQTNPGLWAQVQGESIVFCDVSSNVRGYNGTYLMNLMRNNWDHIVKMDYAINQIDWKLQRPTIVTTDIMTGFGYGHSGYPIEVWFDWSPSMFNMTLITEGQSWGMCHEIGHNIQDPRWTYIGLGEVTNNVLCLFNYDKFWHADRYGENPISLGSNVADISAYLDAGANFNDYQNNPWIGLAIYAQMANHFGWGFYKTVFKYYNDNNLTPYDDDSKIQTWTKVTSIVSGQNLIPMFEFWGIPILDGVQEAVADLPCYFPIDFMTKLSAIQTAKVLADYPNCNSKSIFFQDYDPTSDMAGSLTNFIVQS